MSRTATRPRPLNERRATEQIVYGVVERLGPLSAREVERQIMGFTEQTIRRALDALAEDGFVECVIGRDRGRRWRGCA